VPRKIRQLKTDLRKAGFIELPSRGKGSHTYWIHPEHTDVTVTIAGRDGADARDYQESEVRKAIVRTETED
jgi:predicted RNA binding protein YcfA (HicA-like mRNA interferase family)